MMLQLACDLVHILKIVKVVTQICIYNVIADFYKLGCTERCGGCIT
jgi:hypothetical protein